MDEHLAAIVRTLSERIAELEIDKASLKFLADKATAELNEHLAKAEEVALDQPDA